MGTNTPNLDHAQKSEYIERHLFNELRWLLGAATEWSVQDQLKLEIVGYDVQVYAMDSAFAHARSLFEFFVKETNNNHYGCNEFLGGNTVLTSRDYQNWARPLHRFFMHAQDRSRPTPLMSSGVAKDLNRMPVDFAREILRLWEEFEKMIAKSGDPRDRVLYELAREKRKEAIENARCVVNCPIAQDQAAAKGYELKPVF
jgi:hypothetical protein